MWLCHGSLGRHSQLFLQQRLISAAVDSSPWRQHTVFTSNLSVWFCEARFSCFFFFFYCHTGWIFLFKHATTYICKQLIPVHPCHSQRETQSLPLLLESLATSKLTPNHAASLQSLPGSHLVISLLTLPSHITPDACFRQIQTCLQKLNSHIPCCSRIY